jgi:putative NADH-flavin reductase
VPLAETVREEVAMDILVFGASGTIGRVIAAELLERGHTVTGVTRGGDPIEGLDAVEAGDATDPASVAARVAGHDAVVSAVGPRRGSADDTSLLVDAAAAVSEGLRRAGRSRVVVLGGAGSLLLPSGQRVVEAPDFPDAWKANALAQANSQ